MPKRGGFGAQRNYNGGGGMSSGGGSRFSNLKFEHNEHDDRDRIDRGGMDRDRNKERNSTRRVSFKPSLLQSAGGIKKRVAEMAIRSRLEDDEDMDNFATSSKFEERNNGPRRKGSPIPKGKFGRFRKLMPSNFGWYQVAIPGANHYSKDVVIRTLLQALSPHIFIPHYWNTEKNCIIFYVDDFHIAERLKQCDRTIEMADGYRICTRVRSGCPNVTMDEHFKEKIKLVMAKRYNANTQALDLSKFHADPDFKDVFCGLFRRPVMTAVFDIIEKNIPELKALNLNDNNISMTDNAVSELVKNIQQKLPQLKILYLGDNKIASLSHLLPLKSIPIVELVLKGNPLRSRFKDHALYVSEVRRKFPKVVKLDGVELQPQILFDVNDTSSLPQAKASFLCDAAGIDIVRQFLEQYFIIFDSDNRQPLLDAYHEQAMLSMSIPPASQAGRLNSFWKFNRNFRRVMNNEDTVKIRQLKVGRLAVVSTLAELPKTQHDPQTFSVDLTLFTPKLISFTVGGLFKELDANTSGGGDIRYFQRQFVIVPAGGGFCIRNEMIFITSATNAQARTFLKPVAAVGAHHHVSSGSSLQQRLQMNQPSTSAAAAAQMPLSSPATMLQQQQQQSNIVINDATKMQMVQAMSAQSNMNIEWSKKCLEETNWDYNHAAFVFNKLHKENKIPPEAFIK